MLNKDLGNEWEWHSTLHADQRSANADGVAVDFTNCGPEITCLVNVGDNPGNDATLDIKLQESEDGTNDWTDIEGAAMPQIVGDQSGVVVSKTFFNRSKRYVRAKATQAGTSDVIDYGVILGGHKLIL